MGAGCGARAGPMRPGRQFDKNVFISSFLLLSLNQPKQNWLKFLLITTALHELQCAISKVQGPGDGPFRSPFSIKLALISQTLDASINFSFKGNETF